MRSGRASWVVLLAGAILVIVLLVLCIGSIREGYDAGKALPHQGSGTLAEDTRVLVPNDFIYYSYEFGRNDSLVFNLTANEPVNFLVMDQDNLHRFLQDKSVYTFLGDIYGYSLSGYVKENTTDLNGNISGLTGRYYMVVDNAKANGESARPATVHVTIGCGVV